MCSSDLPGSSGWASQYVKLTPSLAASDTATGVNNGMMGVTWIDLDGNGTADVLYGTDLQGKVWKFNIKSSNPAEWTSAFKSSATDVPFFIANTCTTSDTSCATPAAITTNPVAMVPTFGGVMVSFGTGRADRKSTRLNSSH